MKRRNFVNLFFRSKKKGQISILMALIFPILFVFFAMTINIGLVVHDKINLQTSADLAAYYAAQKQAEILNAIAHLNYQIRQNWKLLSFRIYAFGMVGLGEDNSTFLHPFRSPNRAYEGDGWRPVSTVCTQIHGFWQERFFSDPVGNTSSNQNLCTTPVFEIASIPIPAFVPGILSQVNQIARDDTIGRLQDIQAVCVLHGTTNWIVAGMWIKSYVKALYYRKRAIKELAERLRDGKDLLGFDIEDGAYETFISNLTRSNREAFDRNDFNLFNSIEGIEWDRWLIERPLNTIVYYTDSKATGDINNAGVPTCSYTPAPHFKLPEHYDEYRALQNILDELEGYSLALSSPNNTPIDSTGVNLSAIISYEKNPWYMVYSGVRVQTSPRQPFSPFISEPLVMNARAFAKPFGGKMGPWMYESWPRGTDRSEGDPSRRLDVLLPPVKDPNTNFQLPNPLTVGHASPNYARYPGDIYGLRSFAALSVYNDSMKPDRLSYLDFYDNIPIFPPDPQYKFDPLASPSQANSKARIVEIMAISPDLFDITYYSIDPRFYINHSDISDPQLEFRRMTLDIGGSPDIAHYPPNSFGVIDQWAFANDLSKSMHVQGISNYNPVGRVPDAKWFVNNWTHLLTGWVPDTDKQFGQCSNAGDLTLSNRTNESLPGSCGIGGRMGYSVKLISKRYLTSDLPLGGAGNTGKIMQQPPF